MLSIHFTHKLVSLEKTLLGINVDEYVFDELLAIDFESQLGSNDLVFAILLEEEAAVYWDLLQASSKVEYITDDLILCMCDDVEIMIFNGNTHAFFFTKKKNREQADELLNSLL